LKVILYSVMKKKTNIALIGYHDGSAGQINSWINEQNDYEISLFCVGINNNFKYPDIEYENSKKNIKNTSFPENKSFQNKLFVDHDNWIDEIINKNIGNVICLNENNQLRHNEIQLCEQRNLNLINIIHPTVKIMKDVKIGSGVWINANSYIGYKCQIGNGVIINSSCSIDHHNLIENYSQIDPGVVTAGNVTIKKYAHVHTHATIVNKIIIEENVEISAGSVVFKNTKKNNLYIGNPARLINKG
tara:strand:+ start:4429 stop:5163 length:735 start_codon:yes stop_codon:yes gene_type:complete